MPSISVYFLSLMPFLECLIPKANFIRVGHIQYLKACSCFIVIFDHSVLLARNLGSVWFSWMILLLKQRNIQDYIYMLCKQMVKQVLYMDAVGDLHLVQ